MFEIVKEKRSDGGKCGGILSVVDAIFAIGVSI